MAHEPKPKTIELLGSKVYYWDFNPGLKKTIVMIHGFRGTHHGLQYIIDKLPGYRIIVPDLPAFGQSSPMQDHRHNIEGYSELVKLFIQLVAPPKPHLLGHSFGTIIAANIAATSPQLIQKLILINPVAEVSNGLGFTIGLGKFYFWVACKLLPSRIGESLLRSRALILAGSIYMAKTKNRDLRKLIHKNHVTHFGSFYDRKSLNEAYIASVSHCVSEYAEAITMPTLLIAGDSDAITPLAGQRRLIEKLENAKLVTLLNVGHLVHYEQPSQAANAIQSFLANE